MHYATCQKVDLFSYEVIVLFNLPNPSSCTISLGVSQPLTEMNTGNFLGVNGGRRLKQTILQPRVSQLSRKCGNLDVSQRYWSPRPVTEIALETAILLKPKYYPDFFILTM
jgi:hypothetical protein